MTELPPPRRIYRKLDRLERLLRRQASVIACITSLMELLMPGQSEALTEVASLRQAIVDDQASDQAVVDKLDAAIAQAKADGDTTALIAAVQEAKAQISAVTSPNA